MGRYITTTGTAGAVTRIVNSNYSAVVNDRILCTGGGFSITLPSTGSLLDGDTIQIIDAFGNSYGSNITVVRNGANIQNLAQDLTINVNNAVITLIYSTSLGWIISK